MWIHGLRSGPPASSSSTRYLPLSLSRAATGQPAEPAPVTIKSKVSAAPVTDEPLVILKSAITRPTIAKGGGGGKGAGLGIAHAQGGDEGGLWNVDLAELAHPLF